MKISGNDKLLLFEQEVLALVFIALLGVAFYAFIDNVLFYIAAISLGFILYFWMVYEEEVHKTGYKHVYFEHTSSYVMIAQTALALQLLFTAVLAMPLSYMFLVVSVIMYSVSLSRIATFKALFKDVR